MFAIMEEMHERLIAARKAAGFKTAQEAAESLDVKYPTYAGHENGTTGLRLDVAAKYARKFKVSIDWLATGRGKGPRAIPLDQPADWKLDLQEAIRAGVAAGVPGPAITEFAVDELVRLRADQLHQRTQAQGQATESQDSAEIALPERTQAQR